MRDKRCLSTKPAEDQENQSIATGNEIDSDFNPFDDHLLLIINATTAGIYARQGHLFVPFSEEGLHRIVSAE